MFRKNDNLVMYEKAADKPLSGSYISGHIQIALYLVLFYILLYSESIFAAAGHVHKAFRLT